MSQRLVLEKVVKTFGQTTVIPGVDLQVEAGEFVVFVGPSGCGKSTLLRLIAGLETASTGQIFIDGEDVTQVPASERGIAMVFQSYALYPHMSVKDNMDFGLKMNGMDAEERGKRVQHAADILQLDHLLARKPKELSGGQRQRVAIGRAIVRNPKIFLFDEPLSNLDAELRVEMRLQIAKLHQQLHQSSMIYVTHDQVEAMTMADKIVVLRGGHIEQVGSPLHLYHYPDNQFVAGFIGSPKMNFVSATVLQAEDRALSVSLSDSVSLSLPVDNTHAQVQAGDTITVGYRPEDLIHGSGDAQLSVRVEVVEKLGGRSYVYGSFADQPFVVELSGRRHVAHGEHLRINLRASDAYAFTREGQALPRLAVDVDSLVEAS